MFRWPVRRVWPRRSRKSAQDLRSRYRVVVLGRVPRHRTCPAPHVVRGLFGGGGNEGDDELAWTVVGIPIPSMYGWLGASATNLPRSTTDFPRSRDRTIPVVELRVSWRSSLCTLRVSNDISAEARGSVAVRALRYFPTCAPDASRSPTTYPRTTSTDGSRLADCRRCWCIVMRTLHPIAYALHARGILVEVGRPGRPAIHP